MENPIYSPERFREQANEAFTNLLKLAKEKGEEYSSEADRLDNFRRNGKDNDVPMEVCWRIYAGKHWDAIGQYIRDLKNGKDRTRSEPLVGRVDDLILYLILFRCMLDERTPPTSDFKDREEKEFKPSVPPMKHVIEVDERSVLKESGE